MSTLIPQYEVTLGWIGKPAVIVTVPTFQGPDAAQRRARMGLSALHPLRNMERLVVVSVVEIEPKEGGK